MSRRTYVDVVPFILRSAFICDQEQTNDLRKILYPWSHEELVVDYDEEDYTPVPFRGFSFLGEGIDIGYNKKLCGMEWRNDKTGNLVWTTNEADGDYLCYSIVSDTREDVKEFADAFKDLMWSEASEEIEETAAAKNWI